MNQLFSSNKMNSARRGLIVNTIELKGPEQMLIDLMMLEKSITEKSISIVLRLYTWEGDWISLGKNQKNIPRKWLELERQKKIGIVRRASGGGAVLHSAGLTYCLIWDSPPRNKRESYFKASKWLIMGFSQLGINLHFGQQSTITQSQNCFSTSTCADLVDEEGYKQIGSAQYWKKGNLLQHGEILLEPNASLWTDLFNTPPPKRNKLAVNKSQIEQSLKQSLIQIWPEISWKKYNIDNNELQEIRNNPAKNSKFRSIISVN